MFKFDGNLVAKINQSAVYSSNISLTDYAQ